MDGALSPQIPQVLLVEDDLILREGLAMALGAVGYDVIEAGDGLTGLAIASREHPDIAIVDLRLPAGPDGLSVIRRLNTETRRMGLVCLTASDAPHDRLNGFDAGADDYIVKPFDLAELLARVHALLRRLGHDGHVLHVGDLVINEDAHRINWRGLSVDVTPTELSLLGVLARHQGHVISKPRLFGLVWGHSCKDSNVVEVHIARLRRKLNALGIQPIRTVHGCGYTMEVP